MGHKDYYLILGISPSDAPDVVRSAYRDLAHRYHPDRAGPGGTNRFQEINEAYEVLSDPEQRIAYDRESGGRSVRVASEPMAPGPRRSSGPAARPGPAPEPMIQDQISILRDFGVTHPSQGALYDHLRRNFARHGLPKSRRVQPLTVELRLSPEQARRGGTLRLALPVFHTCPACEGGGSSWGFCCLHCNGTGTLESERPVQVWLPPQLRDRDAFQVPIRQLGIRNLALSLQIRVDRR